MKHCKVCQVELTKDNWYEGNRLARMYYCNLHYGERNRGIIKILRNTVLEGYGPVCVYCGQTTREFLVLDHVNGDGREKRTTKTGKQGTNQKAYRDAIKRNFPNDYQILCSHCNLLKSNLTELQLHAKLVKILNNIEKLAIAREISKGAEFVVILDRHKYSI